MICPRCEGQKYDVGSCALCGNLGYLTADGERMKSVQANAETYATDSGFKSAVDEALGVRTLGAENSQERPS